MASLLRGIRLLASKPSLMQRCIQKEIVSCSLTKPIPQPIIKPLVKPSILSSYFHTSPKWHGVVNNIKDNIDTEAMMDHVREVKNAPFPALVLGFSGLVPFAIAPTLMINHAVFSSSLALAQTAYGASILSFLGGIRWGFTLYDANPEKPDWNNLGYSVAPSLLAWVSLLTPTPVSCFTLMGGIGATAYYDSTMPGYPSWFKGLRLVLSGVALLSLWTVFMCSMFLPHEQPRKQPKLDEVKGKNKVKLDKLDIEKLET